MTIAEAVNQADKLCPNTTFSMNEKIAWLNRLDKQIKLEIMDAREGAPAFAGYTEKTPNTQELLVPSPYDELYIPYLQSQMLLYTGDFNRYSAVNSVFNTMLASFRNQYNRTHAAKNVPLRF